MTGGQAIEEPINEEVSSRSTEKQSTHDIDVVKQNRGQLSFRSRKMLNLFQKSGGAALAGKKNLSRATSARDVTLEVVASPPQQQQALVDEPTKDGSKKTFPKRWSRIMVLEDIGKQTVSNIPSHNGFADHDRVPYHDGGRPKVREHRKPALIKTKDESPLHVATQEPAQLKKKQLLPPRLKLLETFYEGLEAAISLLGIRRQMCTFKSVSKTVEQMSKRRFLRSHLAQLKFLFPEVIEIDYVRVPDQDSRREVWDLRITLKSYPGRPGGSPLKGAASPSRDKNAQTIWRKTEFRSRLLKFASSQDEDVDVPQGPLPKRPLGGQSLSSPSLSAVPPTMDFASRLGGGDTKQSSERNFAEAAARPVEEEVADRGAVAVTEANERELPVQNNAEELYGFSVVRPGHVILNDVDIISHFPPSFRPHFQERGRELNTIEKIDSAHGFLQITGTSHFAPSFKPMFQARQRELSSLSKVSSGRGPSEVHLQSSSISSRITTHLSKEFSELTEEVIREQSSVEVQEKFIQSPSSFRERESATANLGMEKAALGEKEAVDFLHSSACEEVGEAQAEDSSTTFWPGASPIRSLPSFSPVLASISADKEKSSMSSATICPFSTIATEMAYGNLLSPQSGRCSTPAASTRGAAESSVPNTPCPGEINVHYSSSSAHTPASLSPSRHYQYVQNSPISEHMNTKEVSAKDPPAVSVKGQGTIRSLKFGSPTRPPRRPAPTRQRQAEEFVPNTPHVEVASAAESTPRDESKYSPFLSSFHSPQETTTTAPDVSLGKSSCYFSPVRPQRSRALRFSTPEKVRDEDAHVAKLLSTPTSSEHHFKSPQTVTPTTTCSATKPQRFMSPAKAQTLSSAPATPVPPTPLRSVLYSPPKRTKFNRGSLFSNDKPEEEEEKVQEVHQVLEADAEKKVEACVDVARGDLVFEAVDLNLSSGTRTQVEALRTPLKDSPSKTRKALNYVSDADLAIIDILPAELVQSVREKERKIKDENSKELMLQKKRQQMMAGLPKMFNQLRMIFQSLKRSVLPRNELIKNVLSTNADITDRVEVEERLRLLIELAPDWITKQPSANGDYIYRINKSANITKLQKKILEAS